jgi:cell wall-associated NlpC family hydrolase
VPGVPSSPQLRLWDGAGHIRLSNRIARSVLIALVAALAAAGGATADPSQLDSKRAEAQDILAQVQQIDSDLSHVIEAYNLANVKLERIEGDIKRNQRDLRISRANYRVAQARLAERVVQLYTSGGADSTVAVLLGADSLDDLLERLETANRVSEQDNRTLREVISGRNAVKRRASELAKARSAQAHIVASKAAQRADIERRLAERESMLASVRSEIAEIQAEERRRSQALRQQVAASIAQPASESLSSSAGVTSTGGTAAPPSRYGGVVGIAMRYLGIPYRWGGSSPSTGFDCSGFTMFVFAQIGVSLPHYTGAQWAMGTPVSRDQLQPGDLVFFNGLGHMGIYVGGGSFIHAPHTGDVVKISSMTGWYAQTYVGARRL